MAQTRMPTSPLNSDIADLRAAMVVVAADPDVTPSVQALLATLARIALNDLEMRAI